MQTHVRGRYRLTESDRHRRVHVGRRLLLLLCLRTDHGAVHRDAVVFAIDGFHHGPHGRMLYDSRLDEPFD